MPRPRPARGFYATALSQDFRRKGRLSMPDVPHVHPGPLRAFNAGTYIARVTISGSLGMSVSDLPTSRAIPSGEMVAGRQVAVLILDPTKATDAVVVAV